MEMVFVLAAKQLLFDICMNIFVHTFEQQSFSMLVLEVWLCINQTVDQHKNVKREYTKLHCFQEKSLFLFFLDAGSLCSLSRSSISSSVSSFLRCQWVHDVMNHLKNCSAHCIQIDPYSLSVIVDTEMMLHVFVDAVYLLSQFAVFYFIVLCSFVLP